MDHPLLDIARRRAVVLDGAMGTEIQRRSLAARDFAGFDGLNEMLVRTRPDVVLDVHCSYLAAGADVIETDTFGANAVVLREFGAERMAEELNREAAVLARKATARYSTIDRPRFVSGSVGPGTKLPSLGQIGFSELTGIYREQVRGLLAGGVDILQVETCQDPLQAKAAVLGANDAFADVGRAVPIFCQVSFERTGRLLVGTEPQAAVTSLARLPGISVLGMNCAVGPDSLYGVVREFAQASPLPISVLPNAGMPDTEGGRMSYRLGPDEFATHLARFVAEFGVAFVGGCCGTGPEHIASLARAVADLAPAPRSPVATPAASSLFLSVPFAQVPRPLIIGERTNANGSKEFRDRLAAGDVDGMIAVARNQAAEGAHMLDVSLAVVGRDESSDANAFVAKLREAVETPLMYDSTRVDAMEEALSQWPGRAVINSVNLEDGGERLDRVAALARRYNAAVVALTIDEKGMAMTADDKVAVASRIVDRLAGRFGFAPSDIFVDPLTFTLASGDPGLRDAAVQTLAAMERIKNELAGVSTLLGVSNVSFGLKPAARRVLNSVFLAHSVIAGLDAAIINAGRIVPVAEIPAELKERAEALVFNRPVAGRDPLEAFIAAFESTTAVATATTNIASVEERIYHRVIAGDKTGLDADLDDALARLPATTIINEILMPAMQEVGDRFGKGQMQLPFVLRSAETMKAAVAHLEPRMRNEGGGTTGRRPSSKGTLVIATVRGDVHDIGKNLVDIVLSGNGFTVVNLGTKQPVEAIVEAVDRERANAVGLSGLLVRSTVVMGEDLAEMRRRGLRVPVLLGGAALTRRYVEQELSRAYDGPVVYCRDAFDGLRAMQKIAAGLETTLAAPRIGMRDKEAATASRSTSAIGPAPDIPVPSFSGTRYEDLPVEAVARFVNRVALFRARWGFKRGRMTEGEWRSKARIGWEQMFRDRLERYSREGVFAPRAVWGFFPAVSAGDSVDVLDLERKSVVAKFAFPRLAGRCISDFILPSSSGGNDWLGVQAVTLGPVTSRLEQELFSRGEYTEYLYLHGMGVELAEAAAELVHERVREAWGISRDDAPEVTAILKKGYRGCRYSFGYPACPRIEDQGTLLRLLEADRIGVSLTEEFQMVPELSTSAIVLHHPGAGYSA